MIVVDASLVIHALLSDDPGKRAAAQQELTHPDQDLAAPSVLVPEVLGRITGLVRGGKLPSKDAMTVLERFLGLEITLHDLGYDVAQRLFELGDNLQMMDAAYVVLGERLGADVVTVDYKMIAAARSARANCVVREPIR